MPFTAKTSGNGTSSQAPVGMHRAACVGIYDLGTQEGGDYGPKRKVMFVWELVDEIMPDGRPYVVKARFNVSLHEKASLRKMLEGWRGRPFTEQELKGFDLLNVLGKSCQVNVVHNPNGYADVAGVTPMGKAMMSIKDDQIHNPLLYFTIEDQADGTADWTFPEGMPEWIGNEIRKSQEYQALGGEPAMVGAPADSGTDDDESIPF